MTLSKVTKTSQSDGRMLVVTLSGTAAEVAQALADEKIDRNHIYVVKNDGTFAMYFKKV